MKLLIEISAGELLDRIAILRLKAEHLPEGERRTKVIEELSALLVVQRALPIVPAVETLAGNLGSVNAGLWRAEDELRLCMRGKDLGRRFVKLARSIARLNDRRIGLKRQITELLTGGGSGEEKVYAALGAGGSSAEQQKVGG